MSRKFSDADVEFALLSLVALLTALAVAHWWPMLPADFHDLLQ